MRARGGRLEVRKKHGPVREFASSESGKPACSRTTFGPRSDHVRRARAHWHGNAKVSQGLSCVAGAVLSQSQVHTHTHTHHHSHAKQQLSRFRTRAGLGGSDGLASSDG